MSTRMLIDARHPEETRVAVLSGNRIEEFDFESAEHKQIKGNIYLAKVTRVEPSLQAAFVEFGGNRHGFLAFSEIHPDYYQIPAADRAALLAEEQAHAEEEAALRAQEDEEDDAEGYPEEGAYGDDEGGYADEDEDHASGVEEIDTSEKDDVATIEDGLVEDGSNDEQEAPDQLLEDGDEERTESPASDDEEGRSSEGRGRGRRGKGRRQGQGERGGEKGQPRGDLGRAKELDDLRARRQALRRRYKIQDVIQRRQVLLVQVVKEERGNKGAALTTYLSLAGRYCVLMPNSSNGGGISRKISSGPDRKRLKQIVSELTLPQSMGLIVRTAGLQRNKTEIKRDFDYLARLWDEIRETTLASSAPALIHSDSDLIKRAIRDIYNRDIEDVVVEGPEGYTAARQFMKLLMPSHARRVKAYSDPVPLFQRYGAEDQLLAMYDPVVQLKSGGYLVINPTEALVSIDINSGRSTKEHGIEATALSTNLEAAREIARQLRLRDMAGLVVIDFIDMENNSSIRKVEKAMKDALRNDRARIQVGRISSFGLMEMSRQRLRTGVLEATTRGCPHCDGTGLVRTASSAGLAALRLIEEEAAKGKGSQITLYASTEAAIYLLNAKRADLAEIEHRYHVAVQVVPEGEDEGAKMRVESRGQPPIEPPRFEPVALIEEDDDGPFEDDEDEVEEEFEDEADEAAPRAERAERPERADEGEDGGQKKKRRRRPRGGRGRNRTREQEEAEARGEAPIESGDEAGDDAGGAEADGVDGETEVAADGSGAEPVAMREDRPARGRRRRGSRRRESGSETGNESGGDESGRESGGDEPRETAFEQAADEVTPVSADAAPVAKPEADVVAEAAELVPVEPAKPARRSRRKAAPVSQDAVSPENEAVAVAEAVETVPEVAAPKPRRRKAAASALSEGAAKPATTDEGKPAPARRRRKAAEPVADEVTSEGVSSAGGAAEPAPEPPQAALAKANAAEPAATSAAGASGSAKADDAGTTTDHEDSADSSQSPRRGWWQRTFGA